MEKPVKDKYTITEFAQITNRSAMTVRRMIKQNKLKAVMEPSPYGDQYMIPAEEVDKPYAEYEVFTLQKPIPPEVLVNRIVDKLSERMDEQHEMYMDEMREVKESIKLLRELVEKRLTPPPKKKRKFRISFWQDVE